MENFELILLFSSAYPKIVFRNLYSKGLTTVSIGSATPTQNQRWKKSAEQGAIIHNVLQSCLIELKPVVPHPKPPEPSEVNLHSIVGWWYSISPSHSTALLFYQHQLELRKEKNQYNTVSPSHNLQKNTMLNSTESH